MKICASTHIFPCEKRPPLCMRAIVWVCVFHLYNAKPKNGMKTSYPVFAPNTIMLLLDQFFSFGAQKGAAALCAGGV